VPAPADLAVGTLRALEVPTGSARPIRHPGDESTRTTAQLVPSSCGRYPVPARRPAASATQGVEVLPGTPAVVYFRGGAFTFNAVSAPSPSFLLTDTNGNVSPPPHRELTVVLHLDQLNFRTYATPACSRPVGSSAHGSDPGPISTSNFPCRRTSPSW